MIQPIHLMHALERVSMLAATPPSVPSLILCKSPLFLGTQVAKLEADVGQR